MKNKRLRKLNREELLILAAEVKATEDREFSDRIVDEFKRRNKEGRKNDKRNKTKD